MTMKKIIISLLLILTFTGAKAQIGTDFGVNMFMTMGGGVSWWNNGGEGSPTTRGFAGGIGVGKWILSPLAARICLDFQVVPSNQDQVHRASFAHASAEFLWDFNSTFFRIKNWRLNFYPLLGLGVSYRGGLTVDMPDGTTRALGSDHAIHTLFGFNMPFRLGMGWDFFLEGKVYFMPEGFDAGGEAPRMWTLTGGFTHNFTETPFHRRTEYESRGTDEDWFVGFGIGPNYSSFSLFTNPHHGGLVMVGAAPELMFGRNFSNFWTIRFEITGLTAHEIYDTVSQKPKADYTFSMLHADVMMNLSHLIDFKRGVRWNFMPYLGAGPIWRYDEPKFDLAADWGLFIRRYVSQKGDFFIDIKYIMMPPRIGGSTGPNGGIYSVGIPSVTFGYIHNFGRSTTRYRIPYNCAD